MSIARFVSFVCAGTLFVVGSAHAALLNLSEQYGAPDLTASFISVNYTASDKTFTATGFSDTYYPTWGNGSPGTPLGAGTWKLTATLGANNNIVGGRLDVYNTYNVDSPSGSPDLLLGGNLVTGNAGQVFGFSDPGAANHDEFDFLFHVQSGSLASDYLAWGNIGAIILDANFASGAGFNGNWSSDFSNDGFGVSDAFVPEPSAYGFSAGVATALALGLAGFKRTRFFACS